MPWSSRLQSHYSGAFQLKSVSLQGSCSSYIERAMLWNSCWWSTFSGLQAKHSRSGAFSSVFHRLFWARWSWTCWCSCACRILWLDFLAHYASSPPRIFEPKPSSVSLRFILYDISISCRNYSHTVFFYLWQIWIPWKRLPWIWLAWVDLISPDSF